jgi:glycosyltransferase involved in cell wall biosynthesis
VIIVGGNEVSYGRRPVKGTYRQALLTELGSRIDTRRIHFVGKLPYATFLRVLQVSTAHVYLTYPFVLSWSMMEAMAAGCLVIGSKTPPVEEVITHEKNGLLVDFFSTSQLVEAVQRVCEEPASMQVMREQARRTVAERYDLKTVCLPEQRRLIELQAS